MAYFDWFMAHNRKHQDIVKKLIAQGYSKEMIIDYFVFENMLAKEPLFCPLYARKEKCHQLSYLNCYFCACPYFRFNDLGLRKEGDILVKSACAIPSKKSAYYVHNAISHLDCSACSVPHTRAFIRKHFHLEWKEVMKKCLPS
ncbi:hypothetical protein [Sulfurospirillum barnesii]|uniref:Uncharacterized protein n=1 Tax=Sulfurospirillum barnesii (strain ATCC 700032 / DSM 10660 / SES-3) TaxID=760154 RepID=I3XXS4_SULBS|nr:hypothetical protein [Sulfurospirillum barnesii]AFL68748.1 hypothetical protein Sulba_1460 [Sulfurospirillum barnesii SES-3]